MSLKYPREMMLEFLASNSGVVLSEDERATLLALVDGVFFASLMVEEGEPVRVAVVHEEDGCTALARLRDSQPAGVWGGEEPPLAWDVVPLVKRSFVPKELAKLSVGMTYGEQLAVVSGRTPDDLYIEGIARRRPETDGGPVTIIAAPRPGVLVFEQADQEHLRFEAGERVDVALDLLFERGPVRDAVDAIVRIKGSRSLFSSKTWVITELLKLMRSHGHGAILALLPPNRTIDQGDAHRLADTSLLTKRVSDLVRAEDALFRFDFREETTVELQDQLAVLLRAKEEARTALDSTLHDLARLSAMDGALLIGPELAVYGAGYMIKKGEFGTPVRAKDRAGSEVEPLSTTFGARHRAALSFAMTNPGGVAFVVSEDGPVRCALMHNDRVTVWTMRVPEI